MFAFLDHLAVLVDEFGRQHHDAPARTALAGAQAADAELHVQHIVDLDRQASPEKRKAYDWEVPVVELEGKKIMKYRVDEQRLVRLLSEER